jgi:hypothetical protein
VTVRGTIRSAAIHAHRLSTTDEGRAVTTVQELREETATVHQHHKTEEVSK